MLIIIISLKLDKLGALIGTCDISMHIPYSIYIPKPLPMFTVC